MQTLSKQQNIALAFILMLKGGSDVVLNTGVRNCGEVDEDARDVLDDLELATSFACQVLDPIQMSSMGTTADIQISVKHLAQAFDLSEMDAAEVLNVLPE